MRVLFAGTPRFGVPTLEALLRSDHQVTGVLTMPDRPKGRGRSLQPPPAKKSGLEAGLPVFQPEKLLRKNFEATLRSSGVDIVVVIAYGKILRPWFLQIPRLGCVNVHASLLPRHRGPSPIEASILAGDEMTGITTMLIDEGVDTGDMLLRMETPIDRQETAGELADRLAQTGAELLIETLDRMERGNCPREGQDHSRATHAPMLTREDGHIDWHDDADAIVRRVRAMNPRPVAWTESYRGDLRIFRASALPDKGEAGKILAADARSGLLIAAGNGAVRLEEIQLPGKRRMEAGALLAGTPFPVGRLLADKA